MGKPGLILSAIKKSVNRSLKQHAFNFVDIETAVAKSVLMTKSGSLLSVFEYRGLDNIPGAEEMSTALDKLEDTLDNLFSGGGYTLQIVNHVDDNLTEKQIDDALKNSRATAKRFRLEIDDVFDSNRDELKNFVSYDKVFVAAWTHITSFNPTELTQIQKDHEREVSEHLSNRKVKPPQQDSVKTEHFKTDLFDKHQGLTQLLSNTFDGMGASFELLSSRDAAIKMKSQIEPEVTPENCPITLLGDEYTPRAQDGNSTDELQDDILFPKLDRQLTKLAHYPSIENPSVYQVGSNYYYSMYVDFFPKKFKPMSELKKAIPKGVEYRLSLLMNTGKPFRHAINSIVSSFIPFASDRNAYIKEAFDKLKDKSGTRLKLQMHVVTSAPSMSQLKRNRQQLIAAFAEWGSASLALDTADPKETYISSAIGASPKSPVEAGLPFVDEAAFISPLYKPTSQWSSGSVLFCSEDGQLMPFQPASAQQESAATAIVAKPRMGKSVLANSILVSLATQSGLQRFPRFAAFDIGDSTSGAIDILRDGLPDDEKHLVKNVKMENTEEHTKNIFDLQLGASRPLPMERGQIQRFIMLLISEPGEEAKEGMSDLVALAIDAAYEYVESETGNRVYIQGAHPKLDAIIEKHEINVINNETPLLQIRDQLFDRELYREAEIAQSYYVPTLKELPVIISQNNKLVREYGEASTFGDLIARLGSKIRGALRQYPCLAGHTEMDLAGARIISVDLTNVTEKGGGMAAKKTSIMYAIAAYAAANDFFLNTNQVQYFDTKYQEYQHERISEIAEDLKVIQMDEFHRPAESPEALAMVEQYLLEGPKSKVAVTLISQFVEHFKHLLSACTNIFFLGRPPEKELKHIDDAINLSESEKDVLMHRTHGPGRGGSAMLHWMSTNKGQFSQFVRFPYGPVGLWGLGTSGDDKILKRRMTERFGGAKGRYLLAHYYPAATVKAEIDRLKEMGEVGENGKSAIDIIFEGIVSRAFQDKLV